MFQACRRRYVDTNDRQMNVDWEAGETRRTRRRGRPARRADGRWRGGGFPVDRMEEESQAKDKHTDAHEYTVWPEHGARVEVATDETT